MKAQSKSEIFHNLKLLGASLYILFIDYTYKNLYNF